jgi:hypothetical protein
MSSHQTNKKCQCSLKTNKKTKMTPIFLIRQKCPYKFEKKKLKKMVNV